MASRIYSSRSAGLHRPLAPLPASRARSSPSGRRLRPGRGAQRRPPLSLSVVESPSSEGTCESTQGAPGGPTSSPHLKILDLKSLFPYQVTHSFQELGPGCVFVGTLFSIVLPGACKGTGNPGQKRIPHLLTPGSQLRLGTGWGGVGGCAVSRDTGVWVCSDAPAVMALGGSRRWDPSKPL